jgi:hypothetical protein
VAEVSLSVDNGGYRFGYSSINRTRRGSLPLYGTISARYTSQFSPQVPRMQVLLARKRMCALNGRRRGDFPAEILESSAKAMTTAIPKVLFEIKVLPP